LKQRVILVASKKGLPLCLYWLEVFIHARVCGAAVCPPYTTDQRPGRFPRSLRVSRLDSSSLAPCSSHPLGLGRRCTRLYAPHKAQVNSSFHTESNPLESFPALTEYRGTFSTSSLFHQLLPVFSRPADCRALKISLIYSFLRVT
jgi:hypothetical protein